MQAIGVITSGPGDNRGLEGAGNNTLREEKHLPYVEMGRQVETKLTRLADDRQMIIDFVNSNRNKVKDWRFSPLVIYPGTTFWNEHERFGINLDGINEVEPVGLPCSYVRGVKWHDLLSDMVTLYRISLESQLKGKALNPIIAPSVTFQ